MALSLSYSSGVMLGLWAADLIDIIPLVIISHLDKMYCMVAVQVWVCRVFTVSGESDSPGRIYED